ncbi:hypothetical protein B0T26DRAFT_669834 [Lasiosphaeria miniovina]|uniref:DUF7707 domain-containing protein n=1 Tax=Lasiosphaeria miniovina TaxID=1954250 RepID=A0AA40BFS4_9PEZI|nr:uncharacterized protein B0T26DRAFT_669834 [Lasiosphaeria miniovina]KAK0733425.1 hypothetical protein B0T26DRAFT_669834 [Lasiosphaeria miniovina]
MRYNVVLATLSAFTAVASAQNLSATIDPASVDSVTKGQWCNAQYQTCNILCAQSPTKDDCITETLNYTCTCQDGKTPELEKYIQTIPTFECETAFARCQAANAMDAIAQGKCKEIKNQCGTLDPAKATIASPSSSTTAAPTTSNTGTADSAAATTTAPSTSTSKAAAPTNLAYLGNGVAAVAAGLFAAALL